MERRVRKGKGRKSAYVNQPTAWHASQSCKEIAAQALSQTALGGRLFVGSIAQWESHSSLYMETLFMQTPAMLTV